MAPGHFDRLDPTLKNAIRSVVHTARWSHKAEDLWLDGRRIHAYPVGRSQNRIAWAVVASGWNVIAAGILPDNTEETKP